jgi:hypothetical protein
MKERPVDLERAVIAHDQAPIISQPADGAFDDPTAPIPPQRATILGRRTAGVGSSSRQAKSAAAETDPVADASWRSTTCKGADCRM